MMRGLFKYSIPLLVLGCAGILPGQSTGNWTQQFPSSSPTARSGPIMAYDAARSQVVLFGGEDDNFKFFSDTWVWDGSNWTQKTPAASPALSGPDYAMTYDPGHQQIVLVDRNVAASPIVWETWTWDGETWTKRVNDTPIFKGGSPRMAYDAARGRVVLLLTATCIGDPADTFEWDGSNWSKETPATNPSALISEAMAYDAAHASTVVFGGAVGCPTANPTNETWLWDGTNWSKRSPTTMPAVRSSHAMVYDAGRSLTTMFGGSNTVNGFMRLNDTWTWDGTTWTQASPTASPSARDAHALAYDAGRQQIVLFGGRDNNENLLADTWTWGVAAGQPEISNVVSLSDFGGFTSASPRSWVEIYGSNLANTTRGWTGADFNGNNAPTVLDGVEVTIGGEKAFVYYISATPGQVNAQLPSTIATGGPLALTVTNGNVTSAPFNITVHPLQPGLLAPPSFLIGGKQYVVAQFPDGSYVLPVGAIAGVASRPAKPGETLVIYGIGFGAVTPEIDAGEIATVASKITASLDMTFAGKSGQIVYAGLAPNYVGLYQFNVEVPDVSENALTPFAFSLNGAAGAQTLFIAIGK
ncbi:MAG TPA: kelch repeat-containing protein [Bryobacteraceae bacterium]|nr:kelch repeat-containing protein [Bryobacteraceae bacterium]